MTTTTPQPPIESHTVGGQADWEGRSLQLAKSESHCGAFGILTCQDIKTGIENSICIWDCDLLSGRLWKYHF